MKAPSRTDVDYSGFMGGARAEFVRTVRHIAEGYKQGRAASVCLSDVISALSALDWRAPRLQHKRGRRDS